MLYLSLLLQRSSAVGILLLLSLVLLLHRLGDGDVVLGGDRSAIDVISNASCNIALFTYEPAIVADGLVATVDGG